MKKNLQFLLAGASMLVSLSAIAQPVNDDCSGAISIQSAFGQPIGTTTVLGPYDNTTATTNATDPIAGYECFGEPNGQATAPSLENTLWFSFVGDGGKYFIETADGAGITNYIDDGDTQIAIYTGACGSLVPYVCNEDGPSSGANGNPPYPAGLTFNTSPGVTYYMMIDGFNFLGTISNGQYLIEVTQQQTIACADPSVSIGTASANATFVCPNDTVRFDITGVVTPTVGLVSGLGWVISNADLLGTNDPILNPATVAGYAVQNPAPATSFRSYVNNGALIGSAQVPYGTYYWTPVIFGNGTVAVSPGTFMTQLQLDPSCTITGASIPVIVYAPGSSACNTGLSDINSNGFGISQLRPVPATNELNFNIGANSNGQVSLEVTDIAGKSVTKMTMDVTAGSKTVTIDLSSLSGGVYNLNARMGQDASRVRFVKQ
ncbi:MAG: T9SS type A sorting domain-containing protein [Bacteroidota bacterium]